MIGLELVRDGTATRLSVESADSGLTTTRRFSRADRLMILCKKAERPASPLTLICKRIRCTEKKVTTSTRVSFLPRPIAASGPHYPAYRLALLAPYRCWWRCRPRTGLQVDHSRRLETSIRSLLQQTCKVDTSLWSGDSVLNIFFRKAIFGQPTTTPSAHGNRPTQATNPQVPTTRRWCEALPRTAEGRAHPRWTMASSESPAVATPAAATPVADTPEPTPAPTEVEHTSDGSKLKTFIGILRK